MDDSANGEFQDQTPGLVQFDSLELCRVPFRIAKKDYAVREASASTAANYRNINMRAARFVDGKMTSIEGGANADLYLASNSVEELTSDGSYKQVPSEKVKGWPQRILSFILETVKRISLLEEQEETEEVLERQIELLQTRLSQKRAARGESGQSDSPLEDAVKN